MSLTQEFADRVRAAAQSTPYVVTDVDGGFDVGIDVADAQWRGLFDRAGLKYQFGHEVRVDEKARTFSITDESREVRWVAGVPKIAVSGTFEKGRISTRRFERTWAIDDSGRPAKVVDHRFDAEEGRQLIVAVGRQLELTQHRGGIEKGALVMGVIGLVGAVITAVVLIVAALLGKF